MNDTRVIKQNTDSYQNGEYTSDFSILRKYFFLVVQRSFPKISKNIMLIILLTLSLRSDIIERLFK